MARVLIPLPDADFDTTEVAVPWRVLTDAGHAVVFATETGAVAACDPRLLAGVGQHPPGYGHFGRIEIGVGQRNEDSGHGRHDTACVAALC